jgi:hypothetical protein
MQSAPAPDPRTQREGRPPTDRADPPARLFDAYVAIRPSTADPALFLGVLRQAIDRHDPRAPSALHRGSRSHLAQAHHTAHTPPRLRDRAAERRANLRQIRRPDPLSLPSMTTCRGSETVSPWRETHPSAKWTRWRYCRDLRRPSRAGSVHSSRVRCYYLDRPFLSRANNHGPSRSSHALTLSNRYKPLGSLVLWRRSVQRLDAPPSAIGQPDQYHINNGHPHKSRHKDSRAMTPRPPTQQLHQFNGSMKIREYQNEQPNAPEGSLHSLYHTHLVSRLSGSLSKVLAVHSPLHRPLIVLLAFFLFAPVHATADVGDQSATNRYLRADSALLHGILAHAPDEVRAGQALVQRVRRDCPGSLSAAPPGVALDEVSREITAAITLVLSRPDHAVIARFVRIVQGVHWHDPFLRRAVSAYVAALVPLTSVPPPNLCGDIRAWAATHFAAVPAATRALNLRLQPAADGPANVSIALLRRHASRPTAQLLPRIVALEAKVSALEQVTATRVWSQTMAALD